MNHSICAWPSLRCAILIQIGSLGLCVPVDADDSILFQKILSAWDERQQSLSSADIHCVTNQFVAARSSFGRTPSDVGKFPETDLQLGTQLRFVTSGDLFRLEEIGEQWDNRVQKSVNLRKLTAFDGKDYRWLQAGPENTDLAFNLAYIHSESDEHFRDSILDFPHLLPVVFALRPNHERFRTEMRNAWEVQLGEELVSGISTVVLAASIGSIEHRIWLDGANSYSLMRWNTSVNHRLLLHTEVDYDDNAEWKFIPRHWTVLRYDPSSDRMVESFDISVSSCTANADIPVEEFTVEFPVGTMVKAYPGTKESSRFLVGPSQEARIITTEELQRNPTYTELWNSPSGKAKQSQSVYIYKGTFLVLNTVFVLVIAGLVLWRRRKHMGNFQKP